MSTKSYEPSSEGCLMKPIIAKSTPHTCSSCFRSCTRGDGLITVGLELTLPTPLDVLHSGELREANTLLGVYAPIHPLAMACTYSVHFVMHTDGWCSTTTC